MRCEYIFTYQDFLESMKVYRNQSKQAAVSYWLYVWVLPAVSLSVALVCFIAYLRQDEGVFGPLFWPACLGIGIAWGLPVRYRMALRRGFKQRNALAKDRPMFFEFDNSTARFIVPEGTEVAYPWESFTDYRENERVAVLFIQQAAFHTIPKRAMDEDGWAQLRQLIDTHVRKR